MTSLPLTHPISQIQKQPFRNHTRFNNIAIRFDPEA